MLTSANAEDTLLENIVSQYWIPHVTYRRFKKIFPQDHVFSRKKIYRAPNGCFRPLFGISVHHWETMNDGRNAPCNAVLSLPDAKNVKTCHCNSKQKLTRFNNPMNTKFCISSKCIEMIERVKPHVIGTPPPPEGIKTRSAYGVPGRVDLPP